MLFFLYLSTSCLWCTHTWTCTDNGEGRQYITYATTSWLSTGNLSAHDGVLVGDSTTCVCSCVSMPVSRPDVHCALQEPEALWSADLHACGTDPVPAPFPPPALGRGGQAVPPSGLLPRSPHGGREGPLPRPADDA